MLKAYSASYKKESRPVNEDSLGQIDGRFYMVADGVSKSPQGALASQEAVRLFLEYFGQLAQVPEPEDLRNFLVETGNRVSRASNASRTTVACAWLQPTVDATIPFMGLNVGDSRIYILDTRGEPVLRQISRDHTVQRFDFRLMRYKDVLTASCGGRSLYDVSLGLKHDYLAPGEWLIIATDGAWGYIEQNREWFLGHIPQFRRRPDHMVDYLARVAAIKRRDDATIILIQNED